MEESFLEHELIHAKNKSKAIMQEQRNEMRDILNEISDIVHLDVFSTGDVDQKLDSADKKRDNTIHKIGKLDHDLTKGYAEPKQTNSSSKPTSSSSKMPRAKGKTQHHFTITLRRTEKVTYIRKKARLQDIRMLF